MKNGKMRTYGVMRTDLYYNGERVSRAEMEELLGKNFVDKCIEDAEQRVYAEKEHVSTFPTKRGDLTVKIFGNYRVRRWTRR